VIKVIQMVWRPTILSLSRLADPRPAFGGSARNPDNLCYVFDVEVGILSGSHSNQV